MKMRRVLVLGAVLCSCTALVLALNTSPPVQKARSAADAAQISAGSGVNAELQRGSGQASIEKTASLPEGIKTDPAAQTREAVPGATSVVIEQGIAKLADHIKYGLLDAGEARACEDCLTPNTDLGDIGDVVWGYTVSGDCATEGKWYASFNGYSGFIYHWDLCGLTGPGTASFDSDIKIVDSTCTILAGVDGNSTCNYNADDFTWTCTADGTYYVVIAPYNSSSSHTCDGDPNDTFTLAYYAEGDPCFGNEPVNDDCNSVTPVLLADGVPQVFNGDNTCATHDGSAFGPEGEVWHAIELGPDTTYGLGWNVTLDYCGTTPAFGNAWLNFATDCPSTTVTAAGTFDTTTCVDGNVTIRWLNLPPGQYWYPVMNDPANGAVGPYTVNVVAVEAPPSYCAASGGCDEYISNVLMGTIDNTSDCSGYADYTALFTKVALGIPSSITVTNGNPYSSDQCAIWVDWNQDLDFEDPNEAITMTVGTGDGPYTADIVAPLDAVLGDTVMRVRINYNAAPPICGDTTYGEVEDYTLNVVEPPPFGACCVGATCLLTDEDDCLNNQGGTYLGDGTVCDPNPCAGACCFADGTCQELDVAGCATAGGVYQGGATVCDPNPCPQPGACCYSDGTCVMSTTIDPGDCTGGGIYFGDDTVCDPNPCPQPCVCGVTITPPYCESFEDPNNPLGDWTQSLDDEMDWTWDADGTTSSNTGPSAAWDGTYYLYTEASGFNNQTAILDGPCFDLSPLTTPTMTFWYHMYGGDMGTLQLQVSTNDCITWDTVFEQVGELGDQWNFAEVDLAAYAGLTIHVRFVGLTGPSWESDMAIDLICVDNEQEFMGACCNGATCTIETEADCLAGGGVYQGDFTDCDPNPCVGACCYDGGVCLVELEADCLGGGGNFLGGGTVCDPYPCPPANDLCEDCTPVTAIPFVDLGVNYGLATHDIDVSCNSSSATETRFGVWYCYTPPVDCNLTVEIVGTPFQDTVIAVFTGPDCDNLTELVCSDPQDLVTPVTGGVTYWILVGRWSSSSDPTGTLDIYISCAYGACCVLDPNDPNSGNIICIETGADDCLALGGSYAGDGVACTPDLCLSGACCFTDGSCVVMTDADCATALGAYLGDGTVCDPNPCPQPGDACENPLLITLPADLDFVDLNQYTCGRVDDYENTCMGSYDGGEDLIYEVVVTEAVCVDLTVSSNTTDNWIGLGIDTVCPLGDPCLYAWSTTGTLLTATGVVLTPGTYYFMIDTYPLPECLPDFDFTIASSTACPSGACCDPAYGGLGCYETFEEACVAAGGTFLGVGATCSGLDCNLNGVDDVCDIGTGFDTDCDGNGVPDQCQLDAGEPDVDGNGVLDACDPDCNGNGIPDACELPGGCATGDCGTVYPTDCGTALDCQPNGIPDDCELGSGGPPVVVWDNGVPNGDNSLACQFGGQVEDAMLVDDFELLSATSISALHWITEEEPNFVWDGRVRVEVYGDAAGAPDEGNQIAAFWVPDDAGTVTRTFIGPGAFDDQYDYVIDGISIPLDAGVYWIGMATAGALPAPTDFGQSFWVSSHTGAAVVMSECYIRAPIAFGLSNFVAFSAAAGGDPYDVSFQITGGGAGGGDCNNNGIPDDCDIADGTSLDCNLNGVPDECELDGNDCNTNLVPDDCDIADGTSLDCNGNGIPDECEPDCNSNGIPDDCDITSGYSQDCNANGVPDECDIADGTSEDCQSDGIPDECQLSTVRETVINEDFEGTVPPTDWTAVVNNVQTWGIGTYAPISGLQYATCLYDDTYSGTQDEWIITPKLTMIGDVSIAGFTNGSVYWGITPYNNYDIEAWVVIGPNAGDGDDILIGQLDTDYWAVNWQWEFFTYTFPAPAGDFRIGLRYSGFDGAQGSVDLFTVDGDTGAPPNDCNQNGIPDECDILISDGGFCDPNDPNAVCDTDVNGNGIPDLCEICGDLDLDGVVDADDFQEFLATYRSCDGDANFNPLADYDGDLCITLVDYQSWLDCYQEWGTFGNTDPRPTEIRPGTPGTISRTRNGTANR